MPKEHTRFSYAFAELDSDAQRTALETIAGKMTGDWWDADNNEHIGDVIRMAFADAIGTPGADSHGVSDFPGIDGISLESWSASYTQSDHVAFAGTLTRENAPKLPWVDGLVSVTLEASRRDGFASKSFEVDDECICDEFSSVREPNCTAHGPQVTDSQKVAMSDAIDAAVSEAHQAAYKEIEYIGSEIYARDYIDANEPQFNQDGTLFD